VLDDLSGRYAPHEWAAKAIEAYRRHKADRILAESNNGGAMVEATIRALDSHVSFKSVHASRGKVVRAEPIAALYEQRKVHHVGIFATLEDQMCAFTSDFDRGRNGYSPDRVDALVWALTELSGPQHTVSIFPFPII
jgi:phage terminase large subunit-like protein